MFFRRGIDEAMCLGYEHDRSQMYVPGGTLQHVRAFKNWLNEPEQIAKFGRQNLSSDMAHDFFETLESPERTEPHITF